MKIICFIIFILSAQAHYLDKFPQWEILRQESLKILLPHWEKRPFEQLVNSLSKAESLKDVKELLSSFSSENFLVIDFITKVQKLRIKLKPLPSLPKYNLLEAKKFQLKALPPIKENWDLAFYVPDSDRGGLGDLATNIWMLKKVKDKFPLLRTRLVLTRPYLEKFKILYPEFNLNLAYQKISKMNVFQVKIFVPKINETILSFSTIASKKLVTSFPTANIIDFSEYSSLVNSFPKPNFLGKYRKYDPGPLNNSLYLTPEIPMAPISKEDIWKKYHLGPKDKIGVAYAYHPESYENYFSLLRFFALINPKEKIIIFTKYETKSTLPNLKIFFKESFSLDEMESLFAYSQVPNLVTGDMSVTLSMEYANPFIYETLYHKREFAKSLKEKFCQLGFPRDQEFCLSTNQSTKQIDDIFNDRSQSVFKEVLRKVKQHALVQKIPKLCQFH